VLAAEASASGSLGIVLESSVATSRIWDADPTSTDEPHFDF
jgi:hypothetical protein